MNMALISQIVVIVALVVVLGWDLTVTIILKGNLDSTVSAAIWGFSRKAPFVPFLAGFVCGHLFWGDPETSFLWMAKKKIKGK